jgi:hypothetical protein
VAGRLIDPTGVAFDLAEVADGCLVYDYMSPAVAPFRSKFLITEGWNKPQRSQNNVHSDAIRDPSLILDSYFVTPGSALGFVGQRPFRSVLAEAKQFSALA